jgi:hypothetical protein
MPIAIAKFSALGERERLFRANRPEPRFPKISERRSFVCLFFEDPQSLELRAGDEDR